MRRRPWLVVVVLVLLGIGVTTFVKSGRTYRPDDAVALATCDGDGVCGGDALACIAPALPPVHEHVAILAELPLAAPHVAATAVITLAPKTSPPS